jgi:uncharacterized protein (TIGR02466 family)
MGQLFRPFGDSIYIGNDRVESHESIRELLKTVYEKHKANTKFDSFYATAFTSYGKEHEDFDLLSYKELQTLQEKIFSRAKQVVFEQLEYNQDLRASKFSNRPLEFKEIWFNFNPPMGYQGKHHHADFLFAGTYYVQVPPESGDIRFFNPNNFAMYKLYSENRNHLMKLQTARFPAEGELYIWPGFIEHEVTTNLTESENRISISFCLDWAD